MTEGGTSPSPRPVTPGLEALAANRPDASAGLAFLFVAGSVLATALGGVLFADCVRARAASSRPS